MVVKLKKKNWSYIRDVLLILENNEKKDYSNYYKK